MIHGIRFAVGVVFCLLFVLVVDGIAYAVKTFGIGNIIGWAVLVVLAYAIGALFNAFYDDIQEDKKNKRERLK
jgi:cytochrome c oxidase subunit IV